MERSGWWPASLLRVVSLGKGGRGRGGKVSFEQAELDAIGHCGDLRAADAWTQPSQEKLFRELHRLPRQTASVQLAVGRVLLSDTPGCGSTQGRETRGGGAGFRGANAMALLGWELVCHATPVVTEGIELWLNTCTHHSWLAVTCKKRQVTDGEFWL